MFGDLTTEHLIVARPIGIEQMPLPGVSDQSSNSSAIIWVTLNVVVQPHTLRAPTSGGDTTRDERGRATAPRRHQGHPGAERSWPTTGKGRVSPKNSTGTPVPCRPWSQSRQTAAFTEGIDDLLAIGAKRMDLHAERLANPTNHSKSSGGCNGSTIAVTFTLMTRASQNAAHSHVRGGAGRGLPDLRAQRPRWTRLVVGEAVEFVDADVGQAKRLDG